MPKYDVTQIPRDVLESLATVAIKAHDEKQAIVFPYEVVTALVNAASRGLRTKAEVNEDAMKAIRDYVSYHRVGQKLSVHNSLTFDGYLPGTPYGNIPFSAYIYKLINEETSD